MLEKAFYMYALITIFLAAMACRPAHSQTFEFKDLKVTETNQVLEEAEANKEQNRLSEEERQKKIAQQKLKNEQDLQKKVQEAHDLVPTGKESKPKVFNPETGTWQ